MPGVEEPPVTDAVNILLGAPVVALKLAVPPAGVPEQGCIT